MATPKQVALYNKLIVEKQLPKNWVIIKNPQRLSSTKLYKQIEQLKLFNPKKKYRNYKDKVPATKYQIWALFNLYNTKDIPLADFKKNILKNWTVNGVDSVIENLIDLPDLEPKEGIIFVINQKNLEIGYNYYKKSTCFGQTSNIKNIYIGSYPNQSLTVLKNKIKKILKDQNGKYTDSDIDHYTSLFFQYKTLLKNEAFWNEYKKANYI